MRWKVFLSRRIPEPGIRYLKDAGLEVEVYAKDQAVTRQELLEMISQYDALLSLLTEQVDEELLEKAGKLKIVANYAVGYNNIDIAACTQRGIAVTNTPEVLTEATADLTFTLILAVAKRIVEGDDLTRRGLFKGWGPLLLLGADVSGKILGIVGVGRIGSAVARRATGFDMKILYHDTKQNNELEKKYEAKFVSLDELLEKSDFISLHVPLNENTRHMINMNRLRQMKTGAYLINTSRGPVVDENALVTALREKIIAGAGLDVFEEEPLLAPGLTELPNTVLLPHIASATVETRTKMALMAAENIVSMAQGKIPPNILNKEIFAG
ncbi:MAG: D-glycerate dehydrogenase [Calditrichae bacterium]|nr:D-glycerate dehydrogenase [Calditrichia bacterium]